MNETEKIVKSNLEYLKKLFIMPNSPDKFIEFGRELLEMIHDFFQEKGGIHSSISLPELSRIFDQTSLPDNPKLIKDVLSEIKSKVTDHSVKVGSPYYIGHMTSAIPYFMVLLEMIIASLNQNQVKIETAKASSFVEREFVSWMHRLIFDRGEAFYQKNIQNPRVALGNVTADGTLANLTGLLVAREKAFPPNKDFPGVRKAGMDAALRQYGFDRAVILVSARGHYSIAKSAAILGLGENSVIKVAVDDGNHIDLNKLRRRLYQLSSKGNNSRTKIIAIIGIAGTTETGSVDDLWEVGKLAREFGAYFHVDACWGGSALLVNEFRSLFKGIEYADSVTIDAHKLLYCPMSMGLVLFRNEKDLNFIRQSSEYVIRRNSVDTGRFTVEGSRPFACLKPWASLKIIGREGYGLLFKQARDSTNTLKRMLETSANFETLNEPELFILNYRFVPECVKAQLWSLMQRKAYLTNRTEARKAEKKLGKINNLINGLNIKLHKELRRDDTTFVSRTKLESTRYRPKGIVVLRAIVINPLTGSHILEEIVDTQNRIGLDLWLKDFNSAYQRILKEI